MDDSPVCGEFFLTVNYFAGLGHTAASPEVGQCESTVDILIFAQGHHQPLCLWLTD